MGKTDDNIEAWLQAPLSNSESPEQAIWDPGFDAERKLVISRLGPYFKLFARPAKFVKRFYHSVYPLLIESWKLSSQTRLYDGFCTIDAELDIRFQATLKYTEQNIEVLPQINQLIKSVYEGLIIDVLDKELLNLVDGEWVQNGLNSVERQIENAINELLMVKSIQCRTLCSLKPSFEEIPEDQAIDGRFTQESVYLSIIKKNFEFREKKAQEEYRQEQQLESKKLEHKRQMLNRLNEEDEIARLKQSIEADNAKRQLEEQQEQLAEKHVIETRLNEEEIKHNTHLQEMKLEAEIKEQKKQQVKKQEIEQEMLTDKLAHQALIKERESDEEIKGFEKQQHKWNEAKRHFQEEKNRIEVNLKHQETQAELKSQKKDQLEKQQLQEKMREEQLRHDARIKEMELTAEIEGQEKRHKTTQKTEDFLRKEIELLVLEKQRAELNEEIKAARHLTDE
jgi:hypothetical protein